MYCLLVLDLCCITWFGRWLWIIMLTLLLDGLVVYSLTRKESLGDRLGMFCVLLFATITILVPHNLNKNISYDPDKVSQSLQAQSASSPTSAFGGKKNSQKEQIQSDQDDKQETMEMIKTKQPQVAMPDVIVLLDYPNTKWAVREANIAHVPGTF